MTSLYLPVTLVLLEEVAMPAAVAEEEVGRNVQHLQYPDH